MKSHAAAARVAAGIDAMLELREQHGFTGDDIESMALGIPKIIQGRLTNPHPVDLQAAQMCLPFSVALASKIALAPGGITTLGVAFKPISQTVIKTEVQRVRTRGGEGKNQFNLGLGYIF